MIIIIISSIAIISVSISISVSSISSISTISSRSDRWSSSPSPLWPRRQGTWPRKANLLIIIIIIIISVIMIIRRKARPVRSREPGLPVSIITIDS